MGVNAEVSRRESSKELLRPESMVKSIAFGQVRWMIHSKIRRIERFG